QTSPEKETQESEGRKKEKAEEEKQDTKEVDTSKDNPPPTTSQKDLVNSPPRMSLTKGNETQAQPSAQQVEDLPSQKGVEETQLDLGQNNPEAKVSTTN
ncbi:hypothetical protein A2U01_0051696, partial [Trifolium medium]|nr:hypothetical protein [Trifolium medium]